MVKKQKDFLKLILFCYLQSIIIGGEFSNLFWSYFENLSLHKVLGDNEINF
jgi:hypothetical protein